MDTGDLPVGLLSALALIFLAATMACTAALSALGRVTRSEVEDAVSGGGRGAERIAKILDRREAADVGLVTSRFALTSGFAFSAALVAASVANTWWELVLIFVGVLVVCLLLQIAASPTTFGVNRPVWVLSSGSIIILPLAVAFGPFVRRRGPSPEEFEQRQEDQLALMVEHVAESEALDDNDREMLQSMFEMSNTMVREVMVPRTDMIAIGVDQYIDSALSLFTRSGYSRVPVIGESVDDLLGVLYLKDAIQRTHHRSDAQGLTVREVMREPNFVPETQMVDVLMRQMQSDQIHIALAVDEYGGIAGLVTIEDLVEELVGEIADEHDRAEPVVERIDEDTYRVPARFPIDDMGELFGIDLDDDDVDTAGGLLAKLLGRVPLAGAEAEIDGIRLIAERFEGRRRSLATLITTRVKDEAEDDE
ncbi:MAG: hemolysin family protein [Ancrocorticia populi]|uniref:hemolysin family protein n=1 Tax=Ancrocorticia populi TaxID=2175228 RepID=UPI003F8DD7C1